MVLTWSFIKQIINRATQVGDLERTELWQRERERSETKICVLVTALGPHYIYLKTLQTAQGYVSIAVSYHVPQLLFHGLCSFALLHKH